MHPNRRGGPQRYARFVSYSTIEGRCRIQPVIDGTLHPSVESHVPLWAPVESPYFLLALEGAEGDREEA